MNSLQNYSFYNWFPALISKNPQDWEVWFHRYRSRLEKEMVRDYEGATPLHWACLLKKSHVVHQLLDIGCSVWTQDKEGAYPWEQAMNHPLDVNWRWDKWPQQYPEAFAVPLDKQIFIKQIKQTLHKQVHLRHWEAFHALTFWVSPKDCSGLVVEKGDEEVPWIHLALLSKNEQFLKEVIDWGVPVGGVYRGFTPLALIRKLKLKSMEKKFIEFLSGSSFHWSYFNDYINHYLKKT